MPWLSMQFFKAKKSQRSAYGQMAVRNRYADIKERLNTESPVVIDGGASSGSTIALLLKQYGSPFIHAFEPNPDAAHTLKRQYAALPNVTIHEQALGAESKRLSFNVLNRASSSSMLTPSAVNHRYHAGEMDVRRVVTVDQVRLDEALPDLDIDLLKLDLQGYELEALKGCEKLLDRVKTITTEVEFVPLYERQALFADIDAYLRNHGFRLLNLYELFTQPDGQLTAGDAVYLNERFSPVGDAR
jgi:FkbM family methyltransferase